MWARFSKVDGPLFSSNVARSLGQASPSASIWQRPILQILAELKRSLAQIDIYK